jgi:hypothetical protein
MAQREFLVRHGLPAAQIDSLLKAPDGAVKDPAQISVNAGPIFLRRPE